MNPHWREYLEGNSQNCGRFHATQFAATQQGDGQIQVFFRAQQMEGTIEGTQTHETQ